MRDWISRYSQQELDYVEIICVDNRIYMPLTMCRYVLYWYHFYLNNPSCNRLLNTSHHVWNCKFLVFQADLSVKTCNKYQKFENIKNLYEQLPHKIIEALKPWNSVYIDLIGPYSTSIRQHLPVGKIIKKYVSLTFMIMIYPATIWFKISEVPCFDLDEVEKLNN